MNYPAINDQQFAAPAAPAPAFIGQGTAVEQSRAVAEVQAAVIVARQFPRNEETATRKMRQAFRQQSLAARSFFRFNRGDGNVNGETIQFAKELARCWGNIHHGLNELRRDDEAGESEMQAWAWDLESNERASTTFVVPHVRFTKSSGRKPLEDPRDVYENNTNNGARRLREMIFTVLPDWYREEAKEVANRTLQEGPGDKPLAQRIADAVTAFENLGVSVVQLEENRGRPTERWLNLDVAQLQIVYGSVTRGEVSLEEEFPQQRVTVGEIRQQYTEQSAQRTTAETTSSEGPVEWPPAAQPGSGARQ
ncbi:hypothetical protein ABZX40_13230 [Streptomyces sp. NPDC004610]|uniref:hypothetical protein n=1 Tax=unclassified Streptomyces TaxID=2593676 RepID=UPI0033B22A64